MSLGMGRVWRRKYRCQKPECACQSKTCCEIPKCRCPKKFKRKEDDQRHEAEEYTMRFYVPGEVDRHGRPKAREEQTGATKRKEANQKLLERMKQIGRGALVGPQGEDTRLFPHLADLVRDDYKLKKRKQKSMDRLENELAQLEKFFGTFAAARVALSDINKYVITRRASGETRTIGPHAGKPIADSTINRELALLEHMYYLGEKHKVISKDCHPPVTLMKEHNKRNVVITPFQAEALYELMLPQQRRMAMFGYLTGWRADSDILTREWAKHVLWERGVIVLLDGEGKAENDRMYGLNPELIAILKEQRAWTDAEEARLGKKIPWVWHRNGKPIKSWDRHWRTVRMKLAKLHPDWGCEKWVRHSLRHTAVTNLLAAHVQAAVIEKMVGMVPKTLRRYFVLSAEIAKEASVQLQAYVSRNRERMPVETVGEPETTTVLPFKPKE